MTDFNVTTHFYQVVATFCSKGQILSKCHNTFTWNSLKPLDRKTDGLLAIQKLWHSVICVTWSYFERLKTNQPKISFYWSGNRNLGHLKQKSELSPFEEEIGIKVMLSKRNFGKWEEEKSEKWCITRKISRISVIFRGESDPSNGAEENLGPGIFSSMTFLMYPFFSFDATLWYEIFH